MSESPITADLFLALHLLVQVALIVRVLLRPHREPAARIAWIVVIMVLPVLGIPAYILLGEANIGRRRTARMREVLTRLPDVTAAEGMDTANVAPDVPPQF
jgi:cardiolipin synthase